MFPYRDSKLSIILLILFFVLVAGYGIFEGRALLLGPQITLPALSGEVHEPFIVIKGQATHIASLTINGAAVELTQSGSFEVPYALSPGYNRITFDAHDKYGAATERMLEIVYTPEEEAPSATASSTQAHSSAETVAPER